MESFWKPSGEKHSWVTKEACIFSWLDVQPQQSSVGWAGENRMVQGVQVQWRICIFQFTKTYILEYIAKQSEAIDNERVHAALDST